MNTAGGKVDSEGGLIGTSVSYHLVPAEVWRRHRSQAIYVPEAFEADGFIHTTNDLDELLVVANTFYRSDPRPYLVLVLNLDVVSVHVRHDDPSGFYPHLYGPLNVDAVVGYLVARRAPDGEFLDIEDPARSEEIIAGA